MLTLGIVVKNMTNYQKLKQQLYSQEYNVLRIEQKEQLDQLDGLLIVMEEKAELTWAIEWLFMCQTKPSIFVWVFSPTVFEEELLVGLGANGVVMTSVKEVILSQLIKNTFHHIAYIKQNRLSRPIDPLINQRNQSIVLNGLDVLLTRTEYKIFSILYDNKNSTVSYIELLQKVWPNKNKNELYRLTNSIFHLRKKINNNHQVIIKTVRSKGYVLMIKET